MNILIIGCAGYIGSHVAREFLDQGHRVTVYDNLSSGLRENLFPEAAFIHGDIHDYPGLVRTMKSSSFDEPSSKDLECDNGARILSISGLRQRGRGLPRNQTAYHRTSLQAR